MSLDVSLKHSEYMFRHEILKGIIIEGGTPFSSPESVCSLHHQQLFLRTSPKLLDGMGVYQTGQNGLYTALFILFFSNSLDPLHIEVTQAKIDSEDENF